MIDPKEFELNKYTRNSAKGCVLEADLEYPKELCELYNQIIQISISVNYIMKLCELHNEIVQISINEC